MVGASEHTQAMPIVTCFPRDVCSISVTFLTRDCLCVFIADMDLERMSLRRELRLNKISLLRSEES